jgi:hypothetical protein
VADPVSWFVIEPGWKVIAADGTEVGTVDSVVGDEESDIFNGLAVSTTLLSKIKYVPAERVSEIVEGQVRLDLPGETIKQLDDHEPQPPAAEFRA